MTRSSVLGLAIALALGIAGTGTAHGATSLKVLMDESGLDYLQDKEGRFLLLVVEQTDAGKDSTIIVLQEMTMPNAGEKADLRLAYLFSPVVRVPDGFRYTVAFLSKVASLNDDLLVGKVSTNPEFGVLYNSAFWLRPADVRVLMSEIGLAHMIRGQLRKELKPFVDEAGR